MRISLLIKTISQIPNSGHKGNGVSTKAIGKKHFSLSKWLVPAMVWPASSDFWKAPLMKSLITYNEPSVRHRERKTNGLGTLKNRKNFRVKQEWMKYWIIENLPRNCADGGRVALVYRRCFKVKRDVQMIHRSFELINIHITSVYNHNLRLVVIYRAPPSPGNGFTVRMFLEEFSSFLEGLVSTTSALLVAGDFNFHIDEPNDSGAPNEYFSENEPLTTENENLDAFKASSSTFLCCWKEFICSSLPAG